MPARNASMFLTLRTAEVTSSMPTRQTLPACCARAANGQLAAEPIIALMKSRRRIEPNSLSLALRHVTRRIADRAGLLSGQPLSPRRRGRAQMAVSQPGCLGGLEVDPPTHTWSPTGPVGRRALASRRCDASHGALPFEKLVLDAPAAAIGECHVEIPCRLFHAHELTNAPAGATAISASAAVPDTIPLRSPGTRAATMRDNGLPARYFRRPWAFVTFFRRSGVGGVPPGGRIWLRRTPQRSRDRRRESAAGYSPNTSACSSWW